MKNLKKLVAIGFVVLAISSCKKDECHECHYDVNGSEVSIGERCGDDLKAVEKDGYAVNGEVVTVHCHEH